MLKVSQMQVKFVYSEKATKFCKLSNLILSTVHTDKSKVETSFAKFVAFSEYMNFISGLFGVDEQNGFLETKFDVNNVFLSDAQLRPTREKCHGNKSIVQCSTSAQLGQIRWEVVV